MREVSGSGGGLEEYSGDEEAGEDEEEVYAVFTEVEEIIEDGGGGRGGFGPGCEVVDEDHEDGDAAEAVEGGDATGNGWCGLNHRLRILRCCIGRLLGGDYGKKGSG